MTADIWSFARHLESHPSYQIALALSHPDRYRREPVFELFPFESPLLDREDVETRRVLEAFDPDVLIIDNHLPPYRVAPRMLVLWHGFGWKGPNDRREFAPLHRHIKRHVGSPIRPNPRFLWQCFGQWDFEHRTRVSGFAPENCRVLGSAFSDDLLRTPVDKARIGAFYPGLDLVGRPTVLFAPTWHYGRVLAHWGDDLSLFEALVDRVGQLHANIIIRFHDRHRYQTDYVEDMLGLAERHPNCLLKFKDTHQDNFVDLKIADVIVSNFSSILNHAYILEKPTLHIYPVTSSEESFTWKRYYKGRLRTKKLAKSELIWKLPLEENGGIIVHSINQLFQAIQTALEEREIFVQRSRSFVHKYIESPDGHTCARIETVLRQLLV